MMPNRVLLCAAAATATIASACSSPPITNHISSALPPGTATILINGVEAGASETVSCRQDGAETTITARGSDSDAQVVVDNSRGMNTKSVIITNVAGFSGSYWEGLDGDAHIQPRGRAMTIQGTMRGFDIVEPSHAQLRSFSIDLMC